MKQISPSLKLQKFVVPPTRQRGHSLEVVSELICPAATRHRHTLADIDRVEQGFENAHYLHASFDDGCCCQAIPDPSQRAATISEAMRWPILHITFSWPLGAENSIGSRTAGFKKFPIKFEDRTMRTTENRDETGDEITRHRTVLDRNDRRCNTNPLSSSRVRAPHR